MEQGGSGGFCIIEFIFFKVGVIKWGIYLGNKFTPLQLCKVCNITPNMLPHVYTIEGSINEINHHSHT